LFRDYKLFIAVLLVALVWGTTFLGIRIAVETIPGWYVAGFRQLLASGIILCILLSTKSMRWIGWENFAYQALLSLLMLVVANGFMTVAEENISSSLAALLNATIPILVFLGSVGLGIEKFRLRAVIGIIMCIMGILFVFWDGIKDIANIEYRNSIYLIFIAVLGWTVGTLITKKRNKQQHSISLNLFYQFLFSAIVQLLIAYFYYDNFSPTLWTLSSIGAMIYLSVFGSIIAFFAFHYALVRITPIQISVLSYINTIIAIFLGWLVLNEKISIHFIFATILIIGGVVLTNYKGTKRYKIKNK